MALSARKRRRQATWVDPRLWPALVWSLAGHVLVVVIALVAAWLAPAPTLIDFPAGNGVDVVAPPGDSDVMKIGPLARKGGGKTTPARKPAPPAPEVKPEQPKAAEPKPEAAPPVPPKPEPPKPEPPKPEPPKPEVVPPKPETPKPEVVPPPKPEVVPPPKPEPKKPEVKKPEPKPTPKEEAKPAEKEEPKPAAKEEPKPAAKEEPKPAAKEEAKPAADAEPKPAPQGAASQGNTPGPAGSPTGGSESARPGQGTMGLPGGGGGGGGGTRSPEFYAYFAYLYELIKSEWVWAGDQDPTLAVAIRFSILPDGRITDARITERSRIALFDESALNAVRATDSLSPPPPSVRSEFADVELVFRAADLAQ